MWNRAYRTADFLTPQLMVIGRVQRVKISTHAAKEDDPARGRRQAALHGIVGFRAPPPTSKLCSKHFQISGCFGFPKTPLAVSCDFNGLRWIKTGKAPLQIFCL